MFFFAFIIFPLRDKLHFLWGGEKLNGVMSLLTYWPYSLFYIVSELWGSAGIPLLFWQCANDITDVAQARRFYPLFAVFGNFSPIVSGKVMSAVIAMQKTNDDVGFGQTLQTLSVIKGILCVGICVLFRSVYSQADVVSSSSQSSPESSPTPQQKPSLKESMTELCSNKELRSIATMVFSYNYCLELVTLLWKGILRSRFPTASEYMSFMARFSQIVGFFAIILQLMASKIIHQLGWKWTSLLVPIAMGSLALPFFASLSVPKNIIKGVSTPFLFGTSLLVASKVTKYALFDPCKEMAYIPMGKDAKVKGKAAVEMIGAKLGRSGGSLSMQLLILFGFNIMRCAPTIGFLFFLCTFFWYRGVVVMSKMLNQEKLRDTI